MNRNYIYKRRLLRLVQLLMKLHPDKFNYQSWVGNDWGGKANLSCGTTACALGWATTIPSLRKAGLRLIVLPGAYDEHEGIVCLKKHIRLVDKNDKYDRYNLPELAAKEVFGLNEDEFNFVFVPKTYNIRLNRYSPRYFATPREVAEHIKDFVQFKYG